jgi:primary-amine oxidase
MVGKELYAPVHQHFFCARIDPIIDGVKNSVVEMNAVTEDESDENPLCNAFYFQGNRLKNESDAQRECCPDSCRFWKIESAEKKNMLNLPTAYKLVPGVPVKPLCILKKAPFLQRAQFLAKALWVTRFDQNENYPTGDYPNQMCHPHGLPEYARRNGSVEETDIVLWHVFGVTHQPRLEDWPVMPVEHCGFSLKPSGFFDESPIMCLPKPCQRTCQG